MRRVRIIVLVAATTVLVALGVAAQSSAKQTSPGSPDTYVAAWNDIGVRAFSGTAGLTPAEGHTIFAYASIAVYDAVMAVEGGYEPFAVDVEAPDETSAQAAVAAAAHRVLRHYLPGQASMLDAELGLSLSGITDEPEKTNGIALGEAVASLVILQRSDDGFRAATPPYVPDPTIPGRWIPTATTPPIGPYLGNVRPFSLDSADQFRPGGPPDLGSKKWARDYNEVKEIGSRTAPTTIRTDAQSLAARFWAEAPVQQARGAWQKFVLDHQLDVRDAARFMAMASVTYADALIACFDAKWHYNFWRPITAIRAGDTDGNDATVGDPTWNTLLAGTPNHPEYPSAHSCVTPTGGIVIEKFLGTKEIDLTIPSLTGLGDRHYASADDLEYEVSDARIWGGIHYRFSVEDGAEIGKKTAHQVLSHHFQPSND